MLQSIDFSKSPIKPKLQLCKNDLHKTIISNIPEAYQITQKISLGNISEIEFKIPYKLEKHHELKTNPNVNRLKSLYLVKVSKGIEIEYYTITTLTDNSDDSSDFKHVKCFSLPFELSFKKLYSYSVISYSASAVLTDILAESIWSLKYINPIFDQSYREFNFDSVSVLDAIQQVAKTFDAIIIYDTVNRKVSLHKLTEIGKNMGLSVGYGNLLKNIIHETNTDELCTRMKAFGKNNLSIARVNGTGSDYVENYASIMYPFERDENKLVLSHSDHISDSLCNAILDYQELVALNVDGFETFLTQKETLQSTLTTEENKLTVLKTELSIIETNLQLANSQDPPLSTTAIVVLRNAKQAEINAENVIIDGISTQITNVGTLITTLQNLLKTENNFTEDQLTEWNPFIIVRDFTNANISDDKDLFDAVKEEFEKIREPKIVVSISIVNLLEIMEMQKSWGKLNLGDTINIKHSILGISIQAKILDITFDYESGDINLIISNVKELLSDEERFVKSLYKSISTSTTVDTSKGKWDSVVENATDINAIVDILTGKTVNQVNLAVNENMTMTDKGLIVRDPTDPNTYLIIQHAVLAITSNNGETWDNALTKNGLSGKMVYGRILAGEKLIITNEAGNFLVDKDGVQIIDLDLMLTTSDGSSRILINPTVGIKMQQKNIGGVFVDKFYLDENGVINAEDLIARNIKVKSNDGTKILIDGELNKIDFTGFDVISGKEEIFKGIDLPNFKVSADGNTVTYTGKFNADQLSGGILTIGGTDNVSGVVNVNNAENVEVVKLDSNGVLITDGALTVKNANNVVVLDGTKPVLQVLSQGYISISAPSGQALTTYTITHDIGYAPTALVFAIDTTTENNLYPTPHMEFDTVASSYYGISVVCDYKVTNTTITFSINRAEPHVNSGILKYFFSYQLLSQSSQ